MKRSNFFKALVAPLVGIFSPKVSRAKTTEPETVTLCVTSPGNDLWPGENHWVGKAKVTKTHDWWYDVEFLEHPTESICRVYPRKEDKNKWM